MQKQYVYKNSIINVPNYEQRKIIKKDACYYLDELNNHYKQDDELNNILIDILCELNDKGGDEIMFKTLKFLAKNTNHLCESLKHVWNIKYKSDNEYVIGGSKIHEEFTKLNNK